MTTTITIVAALIFLAALLYSSVGHAGASGYLAVLALMGVSATVMKPTALTLNILVASIATVRFHRAGCFSWALFWPFALPSIPAAFVGGAITLPGYIYKPVVGITLLLAAYRLLRTASSAAIEDVHEKPVPVVGATVSYGPQEVCLLRLASVERRDSSNSRRSKRTNFLGTVSGAGIGLLSGLTGTGGGIYLTPLLLFMGWAETRKSAGVSAAFILTNSIAGLAGRLSSLAALPGAIPYWAMAAVGGGLVGAEYGSRRLGNITLRRLLAVVLVVAGLKLSFMT